MSSDNTPRSMSRSARETALLRIGASLPILERAYRATANQAVAHVGVSQTMAWPLVMIGRQGDGLRPGALADLLGIEGPSLTRTLDQLVEAGFIERREDPADRRAKTLHLTGTGVAACEQIEATLRDLRNEVYAGIADADLEACLRVFTALQQRLGCPQPIVPPRRK
ncbi:MarR family winged helix-turn-helix transcriptional regulator [Roseateles amylovorans]|jgi:MarR family transcriptional regulator, transcriptional regulator for hemolysin|uniref:MarR family transcriptional regulator n=1 Tax=Roseateles amylovorans TaxID=2978473 RepID=A0ABY6AY87_9BURK|nr:MarR family transcriptional regulator [Roseateles amylovorans]UXH77364.1 MarR family transcriptional regulator [Roseateles amylovorans]